MLVNFVSVSRVRESRTHGLIRGGCRKAVAYFLLLLLQRIRIIETGTGSVLLMFFFASGQERYDVPIHRTGYGKLQRVENSLYW